VNSCFPLFELQVELYQALRHPVRLELVYHLRAGTKPCSERVQKSIHGEPKEGVFKDAMYLLHCR
jgi:hypothetical protein